jgi:hypothetical protein
MASDSGLYGIRKPKNTPKETSSSTSLAFTSTLSSLLSNHSSTQQRGRPRTSKSKTDIFSTHNRNTKKRAARDLEDDDHHEQIHSKHTEAVDDSVLHRSKRKMEEKAKQYKAMKRGDYVPENKQAESLIDFDQKWADGEAARSSSSDDDSDAGPGELVDYEDEYGRHRRGTQAEAARTERQKQNRLRGQEELERMSARPARPDTVIYGDAVQTAAFNPDAPAAAAMEELARKRDRSLTPPEKKHYEADRDFRVKGVGFYSFSKDESVREREMEALAREREETERARGEREGRKEKRREEIALRRREIEERRSKKQADSFLDGLSASLTSPDG